SKRSQLTIRGILLDGDWIVDPKRVKTEFYNHFANQFSKPRSTQVKLEFEFPNQLNSEQVEDLERPISYDEIKKAVWDCDIVGAVHEFFASSHFPLGCNSTFITLIPKTHDAKVVKDFRPISLIGSLYKIIAKILANRLSFIISDLVSDVQTAFVSNRQILDGPFILNDLISWCKHKKINAMIFKVDFEKAFDSVRWEYLDDVLKSFGFGVKWRSWISGCLDSAKGSILVNGSPTPEFHFQKGLKQGDPLSPFLFILVMESLHLSFFRVLEAGLFKGININNSLSISHLFYADDAIFVGKWNTSNIKTIVNVLNYFHMASGLKINLYKSKLTGIGVSKEDVDLAASTVGCSTFSPPFHYIGVKVGATMSRLKSWKEIMAKVSSRLSKWKLKTLSIGGRLTLLKSVITAIPIYHMSHFKVPAGILKELESIRMNFFNGTDKSERKMVWIGWDKILASKKNGRLNLSKLVMAPRKLWTFKMLANKGSIWYDLIYAFSSLNKQGVDLLTRLPRGGIESEQYRNLSDAVSDIILPQMHDRWSWSLNASREFSVCSVRNVIDDVYLPKSEVPTRWVKEVPIKINILAWKISLDKLPTRANLSARSLEILTILCPSCNEFVESLSHIFFSCALSRQVMFKVCRWWDLDNSDISSYAEWLFWLSSSRLSNHRKVHQLWAKFIKNNDYAQGYAYASGTVWFLLAYYRCALEEHKGFRNGYTTGMWTRMVLLFSEKFRDKESYVLKYANEDMSLDSWLCFLTACIHLFVSFYQLKSYRSIKFASERLKLCKFTIQYVVGDTTAALIEVSMVDKPNLGYWRRLLAFSKEWGTIRPCFFERCQEWTDKENDPGMKHNLLRLGRKLNEVSILGVPIANNSGRPENTNTRIPKSSSSQSHGCLHFKRKEQVPTLVAKDRSGFFLEG
ncbi:RNA-directed DNA polymerase, eukaryota, partial [Tanacetum coccineum]